jgi:hypothetical protein
MAAFAPPLIVCDLTALIGGLTMRPVQRFSSETRLNRAVQISACCWRYADWLKLECEYWPA